ncbi:MAG: HD domain-containing protein [Erysipelotrichaceae bacterium]|jgi:HD superfamily phosphohydrolase
MFAKTSEVKVMRDPVHGYVHVQDQLIWDLINSRWVQRLRRIRQLGGAYVVYHCAEHTRFSHSLGVYEIARRMCYEVPDIDHALNEKEKMTVMAAALLHDSGHGPYSHAFESISHTSHESVTCRVIEHDPEIRAILENGYHGMAKNVADVIRHKSANPLLSQMISSQLDADRMDYLLRDAYFTGTTYGTFDLERILRTLRVENDQLMIKASGVYAVENYIMARYHMYWQVYYHPTARAYEAILRALFQRLKESGMLEEEYVLPQFKALREGKKLSLEEYFRLDENACNYGFEMLEQCNDPILRDLSSRLLDRRLFKFTDYSPKEVRRLSKVLKEKGYDPRYYLMKDEVGQRPYVPYNGEAGSIFVLMEDGRVRELSNASNIVYSLIHGPDRDEKKIFIPSL